MNNMYFKGLEQKLSEGCYIQVCCGVNNTKIAKLLKKNIENNENKIVDFSTNGNIIGGLNELSSRIIDERKKGKNYLVGKNTLIDLIISELIYTLHFYKLANDKVLTAICKKSDEEYIPVKSVITDDIKSGIQLMNGSLKKIYISNEKESFMYNFYGETCKHFRSVVEYQKTLKK